MDNPTDCHSGSDCRVDRRLRAASALAGCLSQLPFDLCNTVDFTKLASTQQSLPRSQASYPFDYLPQQRLEAAIIAPDCRNGTVAWLPLSGRGSVAAPIRRSATRGRNPLSIYASKPRGLASCEENQLSVGTADLKKVWKERIQFEKLNVANPERLPVGPTTVIEDNLGFTRAA